MRTQKIMNRIMAVSMAGLMVAGTLPVNVLAAAPKVEVDEAVYINTDYYGGIDEVEIVKGCVLNGNTEIIDYGNYQEVINMTNSIQPVINGDQVKWDISGSDAETFYFEAKSDKLDMELPWTIDVSYRLNGKPVKGEDLAGASGLVTTLIEAVPNKKAPEYYKNNMVLAVGTIADMDSDTYSLNAPGAQTQSLGTKKAVFFLALPGEENTFQIDLGTKSYESMGTFIMMVPATLDSLGMISDVREVKNKVKDSLDLMSDSADIIFDNLSSMRGGLEKTRKGLEAAKQAKGTYDANKDQVKADADAAIDSLDGISNSLTFLANQSAIEQQDFNKAMDRMEGLRSTIYSMQYYTEETREDLDDLNDKLRDLKKLAKSDSEEAEEELKALESVLKVSQAKLEAIAGTSNATVLAKAQELAGGAGAFGALTSEQQAALMKQAAASIVDQGTGNADLLIDASLAGMSGELLGKSVGPMNETMTMVSDIDDMLKVVQSLLVQGDALAWEANKDYRTNLNNLIDMMEDFLYNADVSVKATQTALRSLRNIMDITEGAVSTAIDSSLDGMIDIIGSTIGITDGTDTFRKAKDTMKNAIDDEIDEIEADSNVLNLDINQAFPSFTSSKNSTPASIQIIMRTKEITIDDEELDNAVDIEPPKEDLGAWGRIKAVFKKIINFITGKKEEEKPKAIDTQKAVAEKAIHEQMSDSIVSEIKTE